MLFLNLATKCFYRAYERLFRVPIPEVGEERITHEHELAVTDAARFRQIKQVWHKVARDLGLPEEHKVKFAVQAEAETSRAVWHNGTPTIIIPYHYLRRAVVLDQERDPSTKKLFNQVDWAIWQQFLKRSPDSIEEMADYAHRFSEGMPKGKLVRLVERYGSCLSQLELEGELAHEFGHIQAHHLNPTKGKFLQWLLGMVIQVTIPMGIAASVALIVSLFSDSQHAVIPLSYGVCAGLVTRTAMSPQLLRKSIRYIRRVWEKEADTIAASTPRCIEGNILLYKKDILVEIVKKGDVDQIRQRIFSDQAHHPSDASRLQFFLSKRQKDLP